MYTDNIIACESKNRPLHVLFADALLYYSAEIVKFAHVVVILVIVVSSFVNYYYDYYDYY